jgi:hypothetical protein
MPQLDRFKIGVSAAQLKKDKAVVSSGEFTWKFKANNGHGFSVAHTVGLWELYDVPELMLALPEDKKVIKRYLSDAAHQLIGSGRMKGIEAKVRSEIVFDRFMLISGSYHEVTQYMPYLSRFYGGAYFAACQVLWKGLSGKFLGEFSGVDDTHCPRVFRGL